ncbi:uncharacterized protein J3D65DRAFT_665840 [Phyllosticta citribraziliensis]|uniref:CENP-V/GFA domain-containing protein n=1 Tax=Phyllosticta citribraziliensis TaxID=989973 RepID=A0ABR1M2W1_9PEZI
MESFRRQLQPEAKIPREAFKFTQGKPKEHAADNDSGTAIYRGYCDTCGSFILEYGVCVGSLVDPEALPPKGEFFCKNRANRMPQMPGQLLSTFTRGIEVDTVVRI